MRHIFGGRPGDFAIAAPSNNSGVVRSAPNAVATAWSAQSGGAQHTDLTAPVGGATVSVRTDADGFVTPFNGPDGVHLLWVDMGAGSRFLMETQDVAAVMDTKITAERVAAVTVGNATFVARNLARIDLCSMPYNLSPGDDVTTALQAALTAVGVAEVSTEIYFSKPGTYTLNGPTQTGTILGYTYAGQVLFPAIDMAHGIAIKICGGSAPFPGQYGPTNSTKIVSNATTGWMFDCIPSHDRFGAVEPWTELMPIFEDIVLESASADPQHGGIRATTCQSFLSRGLVINGGPPGTGQPHTGTLPGIALPQIQNAGYLTLRDTTVRNWGIGIELTEHAELSQVRLAFCGAAFSSRANGGHFNTFSHVNVENCLTTFKMDAAMTSATPLNVVGHLDGDNSSDAPTAFVDQPQSGCVVGSLNFMVTIPDGGWPIKTTSLIEPGLGPLNLVNLKASGNAIGRQVGWMNQHPRDTFLRVKTPVTVGAPGLCYPSLHPWGVRTGTFQVTAVSASAGKLSSTNGVAESVAVVPARNESRTASLTTTFAAAGSVSTRLIMGMVHGGANEGHHIFASLSSSGGTISFVVSLGGADTFLYSTAVAGLAGSTRSLSMKVINDEAGLPATAQVYLDGVQKCFHRFTAAQKAGLAQGSVFPPLADGVRLVDAVTTIDAFKVIPASTDPATVATGTATLVAGTVTVADTAITATSVVRYWRTTTGGATGQLSLSLTAATSFTITSTSNTDTSVIRYEVVTY